MLQKETRSVRFAAVGVIVGSVGMVALVALALLPLLRPTVNVYPSPREVVDTASTTLVNNLHATGSATIDGATVAHKLTNTGALNTTNTADGWVSLVTESASAFDFTAPPYGPVTLPTFSVNDATADASLSHCTGVNCAEVLGWPVCAYHGTGLNGADAACYDGPVIGDDSTWRTSVTTPSVTSTSVSDLTVAAGGFNNTVIGTTVGSTRFPAATASTMLTVDASKNLASYAGSACGGGTFANALSAAGALTCASVPAGCATPSVTVTHQAAPGTLNATTEGALDWVSIRNNAMSGALTSQVAGVAYKKAGGQLWNSFGLSATGLTNYAATNTMQVTVSDAAGGMNFASQQGATGVGTASATGYGYHGRSPAACSQRVLRVYISGLQSTATATATLSVSGTTASTTWTVVSPNTDQEFVFTYTGGAVGDELVFDIEATANTGSGNLQFQLATLSTI